MLGVNRYLRYSGVVALVLVLVTLYVRHNAYNFPIIKGDSLNLSAKKEARYPASKKQAQASEQRNAYFGDLHVHTKHSFDAYIFGTLGTPDDAYNFAKGKPIKHPLGFEMKIKRPLDFFAVTDHGFFLGSMEEWANPENPNPETKPFHRLNAKENLTLDTIPKRLGLFQSYVRNLGDYVSFWGSIKSWFKKDASLAIRLFDMKVHKSAWEDVIKSAHAHYEPGTFTTFVAYEYTVSTPIEGGNLHRNVIFKGADIPNQPFNRLMSLNPENLWHWMDDLRKKGIDSIAIPHNSNGSNGAMFDRLYWEGTYDKERVLGSNKPIDDDYTKLRMRNEPLVEVTQIKGNSDTHPLLSPNDEWADFEIMTLRVGAQRLSEPRDGSYVREAYLNGLVFEQKQGLNPYKFGLIGSSDSHLASSTVDEDEYYSKVGILDGYPNSRGSIPVTTQQTQQIKEVNRQAGGVQIETKAFGDKVYVDGNFKEWGSSGLAGVWAEENTRDAIFEAFRRKETFATTGPRIKLRFFVGDYKGLSLKDPNLVKKAYAKGVTMGGDFKVKQGKVPKFLLWAQHDPYSAKFQRIQMVKGWLKDGVKHEKVFDVVCSDGLKPDPKTHRCPDNKAWVNLDTCEIRSDVGAKELKTFWEDPEFNESQLAFYYVRVLENPTCRWSTWDAIRAGEKPRPDLAKTIQERAYSSPIWFAPVGFKPIQSYL